MHESEKQSLQEIEPFLLAATEIRFEASQREEAYGWVQRLQCQEKYGRQGRESAGLAAALRREDDRIEFLSSCPRVGL